MQGCGFLSKDNALFVMCLLVCVVREEDGRYS